MKKMYADISSKKSWDKASAIVKDQLLTHSLLFHPILFCRITNNSIHFFSRHAKRSRDFDNKNFLTKIIT